MQKIKKIILGIFIFFSWMANAVAPDNKTLLKIQAMTELEVDRQLSLPADDSSGPATIAVGPQIDSLVKRADTLSQSAAFYINFKRKKYRRQMVRFEKQLVRACCPLKSPRILKNKPWMREGTGLGRPAVESLDGKEPTPVQPKRPGKRPGKRPDKSSGSRQ